MVEYSADRTDNILELQNCLNRHMRDGWTLEKLYQRGAHNEEFVMLFVRFTEVRKC